MPENWASVAADVTAALADVGVAAVIRRNAASGTAYAPTLTPTDYPVTVVLGAWTGREREGTSIASTDLKVTCPALDIELKASDLFVLDGVEYDIVEPTATKPGGVSLVWTFAARK